MNVKEKVNIKKKVPLISFLLLLFFKKWAKICSRYATFGSIACSAFKKKNWPELQTA